MRIFLLIGILLIDAVDLLDGLERALDVCGLRLAGRPVEERRVYFRLSGAVRRRSRTLGVFEGIRKVLK